MQIVCSVNKRALLCLCVNMLCALSLLPLLLITTSVLQSHLIRILFSVLVPFLVFCLSHPFVRTRSEGTAADFISSHADLSKCKERA